jgi:hypothetical protein
MKITFYALTIVLALVACKKGPVTPTVEQDLVPNFFSTPYGCNALLLTVDDSGNTKINDTSALLTAETKFQKLSQDTLKALIVVVTNEDQLKTFYGCSEGFPEVKVDFETSRIYLLYLEHQKTDELGYVKTIKNGEKTLTEYEVKRSPKADPPKTTVDIFAFIWPEEIRGMGLKFKYTKVAQPAQ